MKTKLIFGLAFLAIGFGASLVFLHRGDATANSEVPQSHISRTPVTPVSMTEQVVAEPEQQQSTPSPIPEAPALPEAATTQASESEIDGDSFYYALHPERRPTQKPVDEQTEN